MAQSAGDYTIGGASIVADGNEMISNSVKIKVLPPDKDAASDSDGRAHASSSTTVSDKDLFVTATASKTNVFEQEAFLLDI